jgi:hypothetical protein
MFLIEKFLVGRKHLDKKNNYLTENMHSILLDQLSKIKFADDKLDSVSRISNGISRLLNFFLYKKHS